MRINNIPPHLLFSSMAADNREKPHKRQDSERKDSVELSNASPPNEMAGYGRNIGISKVQDIRNKVESGYYLTPKFAEILADRLIKHQGFLAQLGLTVYGEGSENS